MSETYVDHGWRHRPRLQGGTDPVPMPGALWAVAYANDNMVDAGTTYPFKWAELYSNDASAFGANLVGGDFMWVQINNPGYYVMRMSVQHASGVFDNAADTRVDAAFQGGGILASMTQNLGVADFTGVRFTKADQLLAGHEEPAGLYSEIAFNWNPDDPHSDFDFENPLLVSVMVSLGGGPGTLPIISRMMLERISDPGYSALYP